MYTITEIARRLGTKAHTLRYYEKEKLLSPSRNANGERMYSEEVIMGFDQSKLAEILGL